MSVTCSHSRAVWLQGDREGVHTGRPRSLLPRAGHLVADANSACGVHGVDFEEEDLDRAIDRASLRSLGQTPSSSLAALSETYATTLGSSTMHGAVRRHRPPRGLRRVAMRNWSGSRSGWSRLEAHHDDRARAGHRLGLAATAGRRERRPPTDSRRSRSTSRFPAASDDTGASSRKGLARQPLGSSTCRGALPPSAQRASISRHRTTIEIELPTGRTEGSTTTKTRSETLICYRILATSKATPATNAPSLRPPPQTRSLESSRIKH